MPVPPSDNFALGYFFRTGRTFLSRLQPAPPDPFRALLPLSPYKHLRQVEAFHPGSSDILCPGTPRIYNKISVPGNRSPMTFSVPPHHPDYVHRPESGTGPLRSAQSVPSSASREMLSAPNWYSPYEIRSVPTTLMPRRQSLHFPADTPLTAESREDIPDTGSSSYQGYNPSVWSVPALPHEALIPGAGRSPWASPSPAAPDARKQPDNPPW